MKKLFTLLTALLLTTTAWTAPADAAVTSAAPSQSEFTVLQTAHPNSYRMIYESLVAGNDAGRFDPSELTYKEVGDLIRQVVNEHPEIIYYKGATFWSDGKIEFKYAKNREEILHDQQLMQNKADAVLKAIIKPDFNDFEKVKAIHDYLALNTAYDYDNYLNGALPADSYTAYGALVKQIAVCDGYTKAAQLMLNKLGIENSYVFGKSRNDNHSWNMVKLGGEFYFMDITWDDPVPDAPGTVRYHYFLVTSEQLRADHAWNEAGWPAASSTAYAMFHEFGKMQEAGNYYYYSNTKDNAKLYRIQKDGTGKQRLDNVRTPYFAVAGDWIYFSNYSNGGYLYKMKTDGSSKQQLNSRHSIDLRIENGLLYFKDDSTGTVSTMKVESPPAIVPVGQHVTPAKSWVVTFNMKLDPASIAAEQFVIVNDRNERIPASLKIDAADHRKVIVSAPAGGYERNRNYTLTVQNARSAAGKVQTKSFVKQFYVE